MSSPAGSQGHTFLRLWAELRPHVREDRNLPARIQNLITRERRFGSRDRRLYRELLYTAVRFLSWIEARQKQSDDEALRAIAWLSAETPATRGFKEAFGGDQPAPPSTIREKASRLGVSELPLPAWFESHCPAAFVSPNLEVLNTRAPLWLRVQVDDPAEIWAEFSAKGWTWRVSDLLPGAVELTSEADVTQTDAYLRGWIEIQDLGSQLVLTAANPPRGERWLDACAGAGGKTLQLARLLGPRGQVDATDPRAAALTELAARATRAGLKNIGILPAKSVPSGLYDGVLVDAPCSGTGTWRRSPHSKWCTSETDVASAALLQREILTRASAHVRPGGTLVYATCSLSRVENQDVASAFLTEHSDFVATASVPALGFDVAGPGFTLLPATHNTDGFFVAIFRRTGA